MGCFKRQIFIKSQRIIEESDEKLQETRQAISRN